MSVQRVFRGRVVKRTRRLGSRIVVTFRSETRGLRGAQLVVPLDEYLAGVQSFYSPNTSRNR